MDAVVLMPVHASPAKRAPGMDPGPRRRLQMCRLAAADTAGVEACAMEIERGGVSYTVDTLQALHERDGEVELTFIVGADTAQTMDSWRKPERVLTLASLAVADRDGQERAGVAATVAGLAPAAHPRFLHMAKVEVSSSQVRERVARGLPVSELVGERVAGYIAEHGLYRNDAGGAGR